MIYPISRESQWHFWKTDELLFCNLHPVQSEISELVIDILTCRNLHVLAKEKLRANKENTSPSRAESPTTSMVTTAPKSTATLPGEHHCLHITCFGKLSHKIWKHTYPRSIDEENSDITESIALYRKVLRCF